MSEGPPRHHDHLSRRPSLVRFALGQEISMNLLFIVLILAGVLVVSLMPVDVYPDVALDEASVETFWPGASADDVERLITDPIEAKLEGIRGVDRIVSDSKSDASIIQVKFDEDLSDADVESTFRQLRAAVEQVDDLPPDAEKPVVTKITIAEIFPLLWVVVEDVGGLGEEALHEAILKLKPILRDVPGVAKVDDKLIRDREIHVRVDPDKLRKFGLTLTEVAAVLNQYNRNVPSGTLFDPRGEFSVRATGEVRLPEELGDIAVRKDPRGGHVYLRDVATISQGFERKTFFARFNGRECKALAVAKANEADGRQVANRVYAALDKFQSVLPDGLRVDVCDDSSDIIRSRIRILMTNLLGGVSLVFALLWCTMGLRNAALAILGIPFAFLCALICMHLLDVSINAVSLFALVLCSGMIVDDAIVVLENIYRHIEQRRSEGRPEGRQGLMDAIVDGANEVLWPVIFSSATTVAAFLPMLMMTGITGKFFAIIPKVVTVVLTTSLFECLLVVPVHYLTIGPRTQSRTILACLADWWPRRGKARPAGSGLVVGLYDRLLGGVLRHRYVAPLPLLGLGFLAYCASDLLTVDLFPSDFQVCIVDLKTWDEASLDQTGEVVRPIEQIASSLGPQYVKSVLTAFGLIVADENVALWRNNMAQLHVQLASTREVTADPTAVANRLRDEIGRYVDAHPHCGIRSFKVWAPQDGPPIGKPVAVRIESPDFREAKLLAERFKARLASMDGVFGVSDNLDFGPRQINLRLNEELASAHGLTQPDLSTVLRMANDGVVVSTYKDAQSGENLDVRVMFDEPFRRSIDDLLDTDVRCPGGYVLQLRQICDVEMAQGYAGIPHLNGKRVVSVTAEVDTARSSAQRVNQALQKEFGPFLAGNPNVRVTYGGEYGETLRSFDSLKRAYVVALVVIYMLLATQFRSYTHPFVIIVAVPFACVGVVGGLLLGDYPFTIMTFIAIVGLTGVVVNDSIVLVDFVNRERANGMGVEEALRSAGRVRLRPILLTTVTTVLGLLPLALGWGGKSKIWSPFASSFAWGLAFSTLITLLVVPCLYHIACDLITALRRRQARVAEGRAEVAASRPAR